MKLYRAALTTACLLAAQCARTLGIVPVAGSSAEAARKARIWIRALCALAVLSPISNIAAPAAKGATVTVSDAPGSTQTQAFADAVALRLTNSLSREVSANFNLFIYVDKAERGPVAQRMFVFEKTGDGTLALLYDWPVSTGRETLERDVHGHLQSSITPVGYYALDPNRLFENHVSSEWNEEMPYAMFLDWTPNGHETGLAIHGASGAERDSLGTRASAGCIRISEDNARTLFDLVRNQFRATEPKIAYLDRGTNVSSEEFLLHDPNGRLELRDGYSVLVVIDDYVGDDRLSSLF